MALRLWHVWSTQNSRLLVHAVSLERALELAERGHPGEGMWLAGEQVRVGDSEAVVAVLGVASAADHPAES